MVSDNIISYVSNIEVRAWSLPIILPYFCYHMAFIFSYSMLGETCFLSLQFENNMQRFFCVCGCVWGVCVCVCLFCLVSFCSFHDTKHSDDVLQVFTICVGNDLQNFRPRFLNYSLYSFDIVRGTNTLLKLQRFIVSFTVIWC